MQIALAATVLLAVVWLVALRPKPDGVGVSASTPPPTAQTTPAAPGTEGLTRAIEKARGAVTTAPATPADTSGAAKPRTGAAGADHAGHAGHAHAKPRTVGGAAAAHRRAASSSIGAVRTALRRREAIAIAFVDPNTADARAVAGEIRHVSGFGGHAIALAVPLSKLSDYDFITREVEVTVAPTVVIVDPRRRATTIVGFADRGEIEQRLADAVAVKRRG